MNVTPAEALAIAAACEQAIDLGGTVLAGPEVLPNGLTFANSNDPASRCPTQDMRPN